MKKFGLLGEVLTHSFSPLIHNSIFDEFNIDAQYELIECKEEEIENIIKSGKYAGLNVTIPYKKTVMKYLDEISDEALKIGSVNTISFVDGKTIGYNTDYYGFIEELKIYDIDCFNKNAYILGTGGASLAILEALKFLGANVKRVSRNPIKDAISYAELENSCVDILVNTTPVGMFPNVDESPVSITVAKEAKCVIDIIFNPLQTKLLKDANSYYNGLYMLICQALQAERIWHKKNFNIDVEKIANLIIQNNK